MYRDILVPVDLTEKNAKAIDAAAELAEPGKSTLHLLHVIETIQDVPFEEIESFYEGLEQKAEIALERWAGELTSRGLQVRREIAFGKRAVEIVRQAADGECDLIVLSSQRLDPAEPSAGLGTLSHQVAIIAPCAVLLVR